MNSLFVLSSIICYLDMMAFN